VGTDVFIDLIDMTPVAKNPEAAVEKTRMQGIAWKQTVPGVPVVPRRVSRSLVCWKCPVSALRPSLW